jgi:hypothetical protein
VITIGGLAFSFCTNLTAIRVDALNPSYSDVGGVLFNKSQTSLFKCPEGKVGHYTIPISVTFLGRGAFSGCQRLIGLYFQSNAPSLGVNVFAGDKDMTIYYLSGTHGWGPLFGGIPTSLWDPKVQTSDSSFGVMTNQFGFMLTGSNNLMIVVEGCTNLQNSVWLPLATNTLTGGRSYFNDSQWTNYLARFYRLRPP